MATGHPRQALSKGQAIGHAQTHELSPKANNTPTHQSDASPHSTGRNLTTEEFATKLGLNAQSIRKRYSQTGSYFQVRPVKLPNRRLLWPADALDQLIKQ